MTIKNTNRSVAVAMMLVVSMSAAFADSDVQAQQENQSQNETVLARVKKFVGNNKKKLATGAAVSAVVLAFLTLDIRFEVGVAFVGGRLEAPLRLLDIDFRLCDRLCRGARCPKRCAKVAEICLSLPAFLKTGSVFSTLCRRRCNFFNVTSSLKIGSILKGYLNI